MRKHRERVEIFRARLLAAGYRLSRVPRDLADQLAPALLVPAGLMAMMAGIQGPAAAGLQVARPDLSTVERDPQTTQAPAPGPFSRHSRKASLLAFDRSNLAFGNTITEPLKAPGGYLRALNFLVTASGGTGTAAVTAADGPWSVIQSFLLRDPFGEPIIQADGFSFRLIAMYGGQSGFWNTADPAALPSFSTIATNGNFTFRLRVPIEAISSDAYCALPLLNGSASPTVEINLAAVGGVYATPPTGVPVLRVRCEEEYWVAPVDNPMLAPPDVGSSAQWSKAVSSRTIGSASDQEAELPRKGAYVHTYICVLRDSTNARVDAFPDPVALWIDETPYLIEPLPRHTDEMFETFGLTRPTGVVVYSFRDSLLPTVYGDNADEWLHTTPGTTAQLRGVWGTIANAPARLEVLTGEVFPASGSPYAAHITD